MSKEFSADGLTGFVCYKGADRPFRYDAGRLFIFGELSNDPNYPMCRAFERMAYGPERVDCVLSASLSNTSETMMFHCLGTVGFSGGDDILPVVSCMKLRAGISGSGIVRVVFSGDIVDSFYPPELKIITESPYENYVGLSLGDPESSVSDCQEVTVGGRTCSLAFSSGWDTTARYRKISLRSDLSFEFEEAVDLKFADRLYDVVSDAFMFCVGGTPPPFDVELFSKKESKARCEHAGSYRRERKVSGCRVPFEHETHFDYRSAGCFFGKIIESVDSGDMYLSHLPDCAANRSIVSMAYAGLLSAAFEWEFSRAFEDGVAHSDKGRRAKELIHGKLKELRKEHPSDRRLHGEIKRIERALDGDPLQAKLQHCIRSLSPDVRSALDNYFKSWNCPIGRGFGDSFAKARIKVAHGDLDKEVDDIWGKEVFVVKRLVYCMQLKNMGVDAEIIADVVKSIPG